MYDFSCCLYCKNACCDDCGFVLGHPNVWGKMEAEEEEMEKKAIHINSFTLQVDDRITETLNNIKHLCETHECNCNQNERYYCVCNECFKKGLTGLYKETE
jgi:hypothetical protein